MSQQEIKIDWLGKMAFKAGVNGHEIILDAVPGVGGENRGPRPKPLAMIALAGCTGMDVVSILRKMRVELESFSVRVVGDLTDEHPKQYTAMHVIYEFKGKDLPMEKLEKAVRLSEEQYCGISATYRKAMGITSEIRILES
ncbi:MAG TPA: OsmC family protein [Prolixibacteraceae bacterium]|nr:OsmC family protein [Prolixibacteraceae bacterium]